MNVQAVNTQYNQTLTPTLGVNVNQGTGGKMLVLVQKLL